MNDDERFRADFEAGRARYNALSPVEKVQHDDAQRRSWVKGQTGYDLPPDSRDAEIAALRAEVARLREALTFYADVSKYPAPLTGGMGELWADCGEIARRALRIIQ